jgi:HEAT repeats/CHAT domain
MTRILFLSANPKDTPRARLDEEIRTIEGRIRLAEMRHLFDVKHECALRTKDFQRSLLEHRPEIVHFAGTGNSSGEIVLEDESGKSRAVSVRAISRLFSILKGDDNIKCVLMNACYSQIQARAIARYIDCVIGWSGPVSANAAICFAAAFYQALGFGRTLKTAFQLADCQLAIENLVKHARPVLFCKSMTTSPRRNLGLSPLVNSSGKRKEWRGNGGFNPALDVADFVSTHRFVKVKPSSITVDRLTSSLLSRLNDGGPNDRSETARQLGHLGDPAAISILELRWPREGDPTVRYWLAVALGWIGGARAIEALERLQRNELNSFSQAGIDEGLRYAAQLN